MMLAGVGLITLNRTKAPNALFAPLFTELNDSVKAFDDDDSVRAVVLPGSERAFADGLEPYFNAAYEHTLNEGLRYEPLVFHSLFATKDQKEAMSSPLTFLSESVGPSLDEEEPPLDSIYGAFLIGNFVGLLLYGAILHQAYHYARTYPQDQLALKCVVVATV
ncbi:hypothetical protein VTO73DRAFT_9814 [Trametes versicolor]